MVSAGEATVTLLAAAGLRVRLAADDGRGWLDLGAAPLRTARECDPSALEERFLRHLLALGAILLFVRWCELLTHVRKAGVLMVCVRQMFVELACWLPFWFLVAAAFVFAFSLLIEERTPWREAGAPRSPTRVPYTTLFRSPGPRGPTSR